MRQSNGAGSWRPLLTGDDAARVREAIEAIASAIDPEAFAGEPSVAGGQAGLALLHAYLEAAEPGAGHGGTALDCLNRAIEAVAERELAPTLYGGFPGVAWTVEHLRGRLFEIEEGDDDPSEEIDGRIRELLAVSPWKRDYDLIAGLAGLGVYGVERYPRPGGEEGLALVLDRLEETLERRPEGITWLTGPNLLWPDLLAKAPQGLYNLGVAHGVPGVIALLGEMCGLPGTLAGRARELLAGAVPWLLAQKLPAGFDSVFPSVTGPGVPLQGVRLAWCYGDLGIAAALLLAARRAGEPAWEDEALALAREATRRSLEDAGVKDAGLCHGSAGLAHLFNRLYQASGDPALADAARFWLDWTLDFRRPGEGVGGYLAWEAMGYGDDLRWTASPGFLTGASGVALALLAAASPVEPMWDRLLLTSIPPRAEAGT